MVNFTTVACRISSRLKWYKSYKNRLRWAKVIVKKKLPRFLMVHCVYHKIDVLSWSLCSSNINLLARPTRITNNFALQAFSASAPSTSNSLAIHVYEKYQLSNINYNPGLLLPSSHPYASAQLCLQHVNHNTMHCMVHLWQHCLVWYCALPELKGPDVLDCIQDFFRNDSAWRHYCKSLGSTALNIQTLLLLEKDLNYSKTATLTNTAMTGFK